MVKKLLELKILFFIIILLLYSAIASSFVSARTNNGGVNTLKAFFLKKYLGVFFLCLVTSTIFSQQYRYIRIQKSGTNITNYINLAEIQVIDIDGVTNRSLAGTATLSSTFTGGDASKGNDGNTNGDWSAGSVLHSGLAGANEWWEIDLGALYTLSKIKIYNRTDCCWDRLSNMYVMASDTPFNTSGNNAANLTAALANADFTYQFGAVATDGMQVVTLYCASSGNTDFETGITLVNFNTTINNVPDPSKVNGYEDFTAISTTVTQSSAYDLTVNVNTDGEYETFTRAWIDWNQDGDFSDPGEDYDLGTATNTADGPTFLSPLSITIPGTSTLGTTRMRISTKWDEDPSSCDNDFDGEVEDYTVNIIGEKVFFDSDGDGIFDNIDIDDDNDGIRDADEELSCRNSSVADVATYKFLNETFGTLAPGDRNTIPSTNYCFEPGTGAGASCADGETWILDDGEYVVVSKITGTVANDPQNIHGDLAWTNRLDHTPDDGNTGGMAVFNAAYAPGVFYETTITGILPNVPITYSFWVLNIMAQSHFPFSIRPNVTVQFVDLAGNELVPSIDTEEIGRCAAGITDNSCSENEWQQFTTSVNLGNVDKFIVRFINNAPGGGGNDLALDDIVISQTLCDTDSDGIADVFDLDSDNDGIPDVVESGLGNLSGGTAKIPYPSGWKDTNENGMHDSAENNTNTPLDTDGDGVPNYMDLDSDNDSIFDVDESGAGNTGNPNLQNGDGDINGDGVGDGPDTDAVRETDIDSNGSLEYFTDGILDIYDYFNGTDFASAYGNSNQGMAFTYFVKDTDGDGIPDYMDIDSNDNPNNLANGTDISTTLYASLDTNSDGNTDTDGDGILDAFDTNNLVFGSPRDLDRKLQLYFDGRNDYAEDVPAVLSGLSEASMMGWIKIDAASSAEDKVLFGQDNFYVQLNADKKVTAKAGAKTVSTSTALTSNQWIHIAATYSNSNLKLYINGEEVSSTTCSGALSATTSNFTIGRKPNTNSNYYHGYFDEIRVFNKALTADELHKMVYQEIEQNGSNVRGFIIPRDITNYVNTTTTPVALPWNNLKRYYRMDAYKDDIIDDLTTPTIDVGFGAKIYNMKIIDVQNAPLPFITQIGDATLPDAVDIPLNGVKGLDAITYDWSIVKIEHKNITYNANQKHLGLFVNKQDASSNPIEFSIQNNTELNVSWYLKLDGFIDLDDESQLVQGDDSMLDQNSGGYIERDQQGTKNSFNYNYWSSSVGPITAGGAANGVASTNANFKLVDVLEDGTIAATPGIINFGAPYTWADTGVSSPIKISTYWLFTFNADNNNYSSWHHFDQNTALVAGEGYTMKGTSGAVAITVPQNYVFKGKPYNGDVTLPILTGGIRLIGNPYPSAIDADEFIKDNIKETINSKVGRNTKNNFNGAIYFWDHFGERNSHYLKEYVGGYATYTLMGGAKAISNDYRINHNNALGEKIPKQYIPVSQGFFVITTLDSIIESRTQLVIDGTQVDFKNSQRKFKTEASGNSVFMKGVQSKTENTAGKKGKNPVKNNADLDKRAKIWLQFDSPTGYHRQLLVGVDENASNNFDLGFDAPIADIGKEDMYWTFSGSKFVIQGVNNFDKNQELPLGLVIVKAGLATIKIDAEENIGKKLSVYIKDKLTGLSYDINKSPFEIKLEPGTYNDRFSLVFKAKKIKDIRGHENENDEYHGHNYRNHGHNYRNHRHNYRNHSHKDAHKQTIEDAFIGNNEILVYMNNSISELQINNISNNEILSINLFNNLGQTTKTWNTNLNKSEITLPINSATGVYIVQINTTNGQVVKKVIVE